MLRRAIILCLFFPVDLIRLSADACRMTLDAFRFRLQWGVWEHPCIFCRDIDKSHVPRRMSRTVRYRNLWMVRLLQPEIQSMHSKKHGRRLPLCRNESGVVPSRFVPVVFISILTLLFWSVFLYGGLVFIGWIPPPDFISFRTSD